MCLPACLPVFPPLSSQEQESLDQQMRALSRYLTEYDVYSRATAYGDAPAHQFNAWLQQQSERQQQRQNGGRDPAAARRGVQEAPGAPADGAAVHVDIWDLLGPHLEVEHPDEYEQLNLNVLCTVG